MTPSPWSVCTYLLRLLTGLTIWHSEAYGPVVNHNNILLKQSSLPHAFCTSCKISGHVPQLSFRETRPRPLGHTTIKHARPTEGLFWYSLCSVSLYVFQPMRQPQHTSWADDIILHALWHICCDHTMKLSCQHANLSVFCNKHSLNHAGFS